MEGYNKLARMIVNMKTEPHRAIYTNVKEYGFDENYLRIQIADRQAVFINNTNIISVEVKERE